MYCCAELPAPSADIQELAAGEHGAPPAYTVATAAVGWLL
jgi:hypothetical protein